MFDRKPSCYLALVFLLSCGSSPTTNTTQLLPEPAVATPKAENEVPWRVRSDVEGIVVEDPLDRGATIVALESDERAGGVYLLRFEGIDPELDGLVFLTTKEGVYSAASGAPKFGLTTNLKGEPTQLARSLNAGKWLLLPYGPKIRAKVRSGAKVNGEAILATYKEQLSSGRLEKIAPRERAGRERWQNLRFEEYTRPVAKACGVSLKIAWPSVKSDWFEEFSVASSCWSFLQELGKHCAQYPHNRIELEQIGSVLCRYEGSAADTDLRYNKGKDAFIVVPGNMKDFQQDRILLQSLFGEDNQVLRHGEHYVILKKDGRNLKVYAGSKDNLSLQRAVRTIRDRERHGEIELWAGGVNRAILANNVGTWELACDKRETKLETVFGAERDQILKSAKLADKEIWQREPYYLGRDSRGSYYYVDRLRTEAGGKQHRVFVGRRGQSKLTKLVGLVEDSKGMLFSTKKGDLRLIVDKDTRENKATWVQGKKASVLTSLPLRNNQQLIYQSLGAYFGESFGDLCEF